MIYRFTAILFLCATVTSCERAKRSAESRPESGRTNVLLVTLDTTRADHLGCYGHEPAQTPTLDALAVSGVRFERAYAQVPLTLPSHASLLTGIYPAGTGLRINMGGSLAEGVPTLADTFRNRGYRRGC